MLFIRRKETTELIEGVDMLSFIADQLRNNPTKFVREYEFVTPRNLGKSSSAIHNLLDTVIRAASRHKNRMRGLYVHSRKGRYVRQHARCVSTLDLR